MEALLENSSPPGVDPELGWRLPEGAQTYEEFRCGVTFAEMAAIMAEETRRDYRRSGQYVPVRRRGVLRRLKQLKRARYEEYLRNYFTEEDLPF